MPTLRTACTLYCPDSCSLDVTVDDRGRIAAIDAAAGNPLTQGFICSKVRRFADHVYHSSRVATPLRRTGRKGEAQFDPISWDEALDEISRQLRAVRDRHGGEAILPVSYGGSNGVITQDTTDLRLFRRLGACNLRRTVCAAPSSAAVSGLTGSMTGVALEDYEHARLIVLWGINPSVSGIHLVPVIQRARERGAKLVVIDPRATPLAKQADLHLAPRPGTDLPLALAVAAGLFETDRHDPDFLRDHCRHVDDFRERALEWSIERAAATTQLDRGDIEQFVDLYAEAEPAVIRCGYGVERNRNGGSAVAAIVALPAVAGKFGVRGGGYTMSNGAVWSENDRVKRPALEPEPDTRSVNLNHVGRVLLDSEQPIHALFVYNCNPLATLPTQDLVRRGLERDDLFTVVFDPVLTDTARYADIVLPATTFLEHSDLAKGYGAMVLHHTRPVIEPVGEARSNPRVFGDLLQRLDLHAAGEPLSAGELIDHSVDESTRAALEEAPVVPHREAAPVQFVDAFPRTGDRRLDLLPDALDREAPAGLYGFQDDPATETYPLAMISPANNRTINSTMGQTRSLETVVELSTEDAAARGLERGGDGMVRAFNEFGEVICRYRVDPSLKPGVAVMPKGAWTASSASGTTSNVLVPDALTDLGGGACFNDSRIQIERA